MANKFQLKRTTTPGNVPNTEHISIGELAINVTDGILYSTNGSIVFEVGANNTNVNVSNTITTNTIRVPNTIIQSNTYSTVSTVSQICDTYPKSRKSTKYLIELTRATDVHTTEILLINNGIDVHMIENGTVYTALLGVFSAEIAINDVNLLCTPTFSDTTIKIFRTSLI